MTDKQIALPLLRMRTRDHMHSSQKIFWHLQNIQNIMYKIKPIQN
jgi:hypothetical protein